MRADEGKNSWNLLAIKKKKARMVEGGGGEEPASVTPDLSNAYGRRTGERESAKKDDRRDEQKKKKEQQKTGRCARYLSSSARICKD